MAVKSEIHKPPSSKVGIPVATGPATGRPRSTDPTAQERFFARLRISLTGMPESKFRRPVKIAKIGQPTTVSPKEPFDGAQPEKNLFA